MSAENFAIKAAVEVSRDVERLPSRSDESVARRESSKGTASLLTPPPVTLASRVLMLVLCAAIVLSALAYGAVNSWALAIFQACAALVVVLWAADALASGTLRFNRSLLQVPLAALVVIGCVQLLPLGGADATGVPTALSLDPFQTRLATIKVAALLVYFAAALAFVDRPERLRLVVRLVIVFGFLLGLQGIIQSFVSPDSIYGIRETYQAFSFGPFVNRHHFANYMLMAMALPLGMLFAGAVDRERQLLFAFAPLLMGIALVMTGSRGAMLSLVVVVVFLVLAAGTAARASKRRRRGEGARDSESDGDATDVRGAKLKRAGAALALLVVLLAGVLTFGGEAGLARLVGTVNSDDPTTGRTHFWAMTLDIIRQYPLLGAGLGAYGLAFAHFDTRSGLYRVEQAHNDYLQVFADTGIIGAVFAILFLVVLYRTAWRRLRSADVYRRGVCLGALAGCTGMLIHSFFEFSLHTTSNALLFLLLAALATLGSQVETLQNVRGGRQRRRRRSSRAAGQDAVAATPAHAAPPAETVVANTTT